MTRHDPLCPYGQDCPTEWRRADLRDSTHPHRIVSGSSGRCVECEAEDCICNVIENAEERGRLTERAEWLDTPNGTRSHAYAMGRLDAINETIHLVGSIQDTAQSGEGIIVTVTVGAGRGHVYVNRDAILDALASQSTKHNSPTG